MLIDKFKQSKIGEQELEDSLDVRCSETKTELDKLSTDDISDGSFSAEKHKQNFLETNSNDVDDELTENIPLKSLLKSNKRKAKRRAACRISLRPCGSPAKSISRSTDNLQLTVSVYTLSFLTVKVKVMRMVAPEE